MIRLVDMEGLLEISVSGPLSSALEIRQPGGQDHGIDLATQPIEKMFSKLDFGRPNGLIPPGNPSSKVGRSPPPKLLGFPGGKRPLGPPNIGFGEALLNGLGGRQGLS